MKEINEIITKVFKDHKILKVILYIPSVLIILIGVLIGMCIGGGQD